MGYPFSRSYGVNLPSSLTRDHSFALELSLLPTSVGLRYGRSQRPVCGFSWPRGSTESSAPKFGLSPSSAAPGEPDDACEVRRSNSIAALGLPQSVLHTDLIICQRLRNINRMSIAYALPPRLRPD